MKDSALITGRDIGEEILNALGLKAADQVVSIELRFTVDNAVKAKIEKFVTKGEAKKVFEVLRAYRWEKE
jgi:hypothetical protein